MELEIWDMLPAEQMYSYTQSGQLMGQTGCIGHLRVDMDSTGEGFFSSWEDHSRQLKTDAFKQEFDDVINMLRFHPDYDHILKNRTALAKYCYSHPSCQMADGRSFGVRVDTDTYSYMCRLNPNKGEYNAYIYCYKKDWLDHHLMQAQKGIRFIDSHYNTKFRLPDGGKVVITEPSGSKHFETCRYIDEYHVEVGRSLYHICEFAERMEQNGCTVKPLTPPIEQAQSKQSHKEVERT